MNEECGTCKGTRVVTVVDTLFESKSEEPCPLCCPVETFTCEVCCHVLPRGLEHSEKPGVCFLDYVSEKDRADIERAVAQSMSA